MTLFNTIKSIFSYAILIALFVFLLKWMQWKYLIKDHSLEMYIGIIALFFTVFGVWVARLLFVSKITIELDEKASPLSTPIDSVALEKFNLSKREYEVLELLTQGLSNAEIAARLFLSLSTVKSHVSNLFVKLDVKSRTQAMEKSKRLKIT